MKPLIILLWAIALSACSATQPSRAIEQQQSKVDAVVYLVRHAEKQKVKSNNPDLSEAGQQRAEALAQKLAEVELDKIYATPFKRTQMTAQPTAKSKHLEVESYNLPPFLMAAKIKKLHKKQTILLVGHSNTVPAIIAELGYKQPVSIGHEQYGDLYILTFSGDQVDMTQSRFGQ